MEMIYVILDVLNRINTKLKLILVGVYRVSLYMIYIYKYIDICETRFSRPLFTLRMFIKYDGIN